MYAAALEVELTLGGLQFSRAVPLPVLYKGVVVADQAADILLRSPVPLVINVRASENGLSDAEVAALLSCMRVADPPAMAGALFNFNSARQSLETRWVQQ